MAMTVKQCREIAMQHINQYSIAGQLVVPSYNNQADYEIKVLNLINDAQMELAKTNKKIHATYHIVQTAIPSLISDMGTKSHVSEDICTGKSKEPAQTYYFEVSGPAVVYLEKYDNKKWVEIKKIEITEVEEGQFTVCRGQFESTPSVRFRFSGEYPYLFRNTGLYGCSFETDEDIPACTTWIAYELPEDFYQLNGKGVPYFGNHEELKYLHDYRWVGDKTLYLRRDLRGEFHVDYFRYPIRLEKGIDEENTFLDNTPDTHEAIPYYVASMLCQYDNPSLAATLFNIFEIRLSRLAEGPQSEIIPIEDVYGFDVFFNGVM